MKTVLAALTLALTLLSSSSSAHTPHDDVIWVALSPSFSSDGTLFISSPGPTNFGPADILVSNNGGLSWSPRLQGLDNVQPFVGCGVSPSFSANQLVVCASINKVFMSQDAGRSWAPADAGLPPLTIRSIEMVRGPGGSTVLWLAPFGGGLYVSSDLGATWTESLPPTTLITAQSPSPSADQGTAFVATVDGLLASSPTAGLASPSDWVYLDGPSGASITSLLAPPDHAATGEIFVGNATGLFRSNDFGASWQAVAGVPSESVPAIAASPDYATDGVLFATTNTQAIFKSTDRGLFWVQHDVDIVLSNQTEVHFPDIQVSDGFSTDGIVYIGGFEGLLRSDDGGVTWREIETRLPSHITNLNIAPGPTPEQTTLAISGYAGGAYLSSDRGASWIAANHGLFTMDVFDVVFEPGPPSATPNLLAVQPTRLLTSLPASGSWEQALIPNFGPGIGGLVFPTKMALSHTYAIDGTILVATRANGLLATTDLGQNWQQWLPAPSGSFVSTVELSPTYDVDGTVFVVLFYDDVLVTTDAGGSWQSLGGGLPAEADPHTIVVSPDFATDQTLLLATTAGLFRSTDAGATWDALPVSGPGTETAVAQHVQIAKSATGALTVLASIRGKGLFLSEDGSQTWREVAPSLIENSVQFAEFRFSSNFANDGAIVAATRSKLFHSSDGGETWEDVSATLRRYEEFYDVPEFSPDWLELVLTTASMSRARYTETAGASASLSFFGKGVTWVGQLGPNLGIADVFIDGELAQSVDQYDPVTQPRAVVFSKEDLPIGPHEIVVVATATSNPSSTGTGTLVDAFDVLRDRDGDLDGVFDSVDVCPNIFDPNQLDADADGHGDACDNCTFTGNVRQFDFDADGFGNACDADYDNDQIVGVIDWILFTTGFLKFNVIIDLNEDLFVGVPDFFRFWQLWNKPPGPSAAPSP